MRLLLTSTTTSLDEFAWLLVNSILEPSGAKKDPLLNGVRRLVREGVATSPTELCWVKSSVWPGTFLSWGIQ